MITYPDHAEVQVGDFILIEGGRTPGKVSELIETSEQMERCGVDVPGIMVESIPFGLVFLPTESFGDDPIAFVSRPRSLSAS